MRIRRARGDKVAQVAAPLDGTAELTLQADDLPGERRADAGGAGELVAVAEDAELAGAAAPAHIVAGMGADAVTLDNGPDFGLLPVADGPVAVDMARYTTVTQVGTVGLPDGILGPLGTFLAAFTGENEGTNTLKAGLVDDGRRTNIDLEVGAAPACTQIGGGLRETKPCAGTTPCTAGVAEGAVRKLVIVRGGKGVLTHHLAVEAALFPLKVDLHPEGFGEAAAVVGRYFPIEEGTLTSVDVLVPQFDAIAGDALVEQVQKSGGRILTATETYDISIVVVDVVFHDFSIVLSEK